MKIINQNFKDFTNKECCITCNGFCWWDGDYCCIKKMKIHQYGILYPYGYPWMNEDIDNTMKTLETCEEYEYDPYNYEYIEEYKNFKKWDKLCKQLENHVKE